ncbi:MAG TPA: DUF6455 family protein [Burkholderiales bacterium]|nr:DUF6455 family protein [Burkholderiales bacterium]
MELLALVAAISGTALGVLIVASVLAALWSRDGGAKPLLLEQALRRQGDGVAYRALASGSHDFAVAVQRCLACTEAAQCRAWLSSGARDGYQSFCPNARYIDRMQPVRRNP